MQSAFELFGSPFFAFFRLGDLFAFVYNLKKSEITLTLSRSKSRRHYFTKRRFLKVVVVVVGSHHPKGHSDLKQNGKKEKTHNSGSVFHHALSTKECGVARFVPTVFCWLLKPFDSGLL